MIANKIFCVTVFFYLFTFAISLWHQKFVTADVTECLSTINMAFIDEDKILIKTHKYTQHTQLRAQRNYNRCTKNAICLHFSTSAEYLQKF